MTACMVVPPIRNVKYNASRDFYCMVSSIHVHAELTENRINTHIGLNDAGLHTDVLCVSFMC